MYRSYKGQACMQMSTCCVPTLRACSKHMHMHDISHQWQVTPLTESYTLLRCLCLSTGNDAPDSLAEDEESPAPSSSGPSGRGGVLSQIGALLSHPACCGEQGNLPASYALVPDNWLCNKQTYSPRRC